MGELATNIWNTLGFSSLIFGFIVNFDNVIGWSMGLLGIVWGVFRAGITYENWMIKRDERIDRRDNHKSLKKFRDLEGDEYRKQP